VTFLQAHEACHCMLLHPLRFRKEWDRKLQQIAADYEINALLVQSGMEMPPDGCFDRRFNNMVFEQIYAILEKERQPEPEEKGKCNGKSNQSNDGSGNEPGDEEEEGGGSQPYSEPNPDKPGENIGQFTEAQGDEAMQRILKQEWEQKIAQAVAIAKRRAACRQGSRSWWATSSIQRLPGRRSSAIC